MAWADNMTDMAAAGIEAFGEPVTLSGGSVVTGILALPGAAAAPLWSEVGLAMRISDQPNPVVALRAADIGDLAEGDSLTARGVSYLVSRRHPPDGTGLVALELMPADASAPAAGSRYR